VSTATIERALQLARESSCRTVDEIRRTLRTERFDGVDGHITGSLVKQLKAEIAKRQAVDIAGTDRDPHALGACVSRRL
jgi:cell division inhibitor SulA